jgi:hypothetical protein
MGMRKDEEIERTLRVYSKSSTFEYIPRSKKEDDYVVAKPMKLPECVVCGKKEPEPFECEFCGGLFCDEHLLPDEHQCKGYKGEEDVPIEEVRLMKQAIAMRLESIIRQAPQAYMLVDMAKPGELRALLGQLEEMEKTFLAIAEREAGR